jgi:Cof subfamily protein (haloacid dehalogenase superfamily)
MEYKLIALDMDATALTPDKRLTRKTAETMERALSAGKQVVFSTGRNISIVKPYMAQVRGMRWAVTGSGAAANDVETGTRLFEKNIDAETIKWIIGASAGIDLMPILYIGDVSYCPDWAPERAEEFFVGAYAGMYRDYMTKCPDVFQMFMEDPKPVQKLNLVFTDRAEKDFVYDQIKLLPLKFTTITELTMEINAPGVSKADGLRRLCGHLGVGMEECVAVGDAENDLELIRAAGLGVAMGNAESAVKAAAGAVVADCLHDGAAEAIERFIL